VGAFALHFLLLVLQPLSTFLKVNSARNCLEIATEGGSTSKPTVFNVSWKFPLFFDFGVCCCVADEAVV